MNIKSKGVSLLEILIVIGIFAIVSAGVTSLSVKTIEHQRNQQTMNYQTLLYNQVQDDLKADLRSAFAVWVSTGEAAPGASQEFAVLQACGGAAPASGTGDTLNIIRLVSYNNDPSNPVTNLEAIRYRFITIGADSYLVRMFSNLGAYANTPDQLWPKNITSAVTAPPYAMPAFVSLAAIAAPSKVYNRIGQSNEEHSITADAVNGPFRINYGQEYSPAVGGPTTLCSFYLSTVDLIGLTFTATGYANKYDTLFGKANIVSPTMSVEVNTSLKFF